MDENLKGYVDKLGTEYGILFYHCYQDIAHLRLTWKSYKSLFGTNEERYNLMYSVSSIFSYVLNKALYDATLLGIRRLADASTTKVKGKDVRNISIQGFRGLFNGRPDEAAFESALTKALTCAEIVSPYINKKIAHADLHVKEGKLEVSDFNRLQITEAVDEIAFVIKWVARSTMNTSVSTIPSLPAEDELWFLQHVYEGVKAMNQKEVLSREFSMRGEYQKRRALYEYPDWLTHSEQERFDILD